MAQVTVRKNNKVLNIEDTRLESYLLQGFDQINKNGEVVTKATGGKKVSLTDYNKVLEELEKLKTSDATEQLKEAKKEIKSLEAKVKKLEEEAAKTKETTK